MNKTGLLIILFVLCHTTSRSQQYSRYSFKENPAGYKVFVHGKDSVEIGNKKIINTTTEEIEVLMAGERYSMRFVKGQPVTLAASGNIIASFPFEKIVLKNEVYDVKKDESTWKYSYGNKLVLTSQVKESDIVLASWTDDTPHVGLLRMIAMVYCVGLESINEKISRRARYDKEPTKKFVQPIFTTIPLQDYTIRNLQALALGDSVFLSIRESNKSSISQVFITPDGVQKNVSIPPLEGKQLIAATVSEGYLMFYYSIRIKSNTSLHAVKFDRKSGSATVLPDSLLLSEELIATYVENNNLFMVFADKLNSRVRFTQIRDLVVVNQKYFQVPEEFMGKDIQSVSFIREGDPVKPIQARAEAKIYLTKTELVVTVERDFYSGKLFRGTLLMRTDLETGNTRHFQIPETSRKKFSSYWHQGHLFRIVSNKGFHISVYDNDRAIHEFEINRQSDFNDEAAYLRDAVANRVFDNRNVWEAIDNTGDPFISVQGKDSVTLKLGTHKFIKQSLPIPIINSLGLGTAFIVLFARVLTMSLDDGESIDHYFYLTGNTTLSFAYTNDTGLAEQHIDLYELHPTKKAIEYKVKVYLGTRNFIIAFYQMQGEKHLTMLKFSK